MNVLFVNHNDIVSNSGIHIKNLATHLSQKGIDCSVCIPDNYEKPKSGSYGKLPVYQFNELLSNKHKNKFDLIHVWTPREHVRIFIDKLFELGEIPYLIHLEDNEEYIFQSFTGLNPREVDIKGEEIFNDHYFRNLIHPVKYRKFIDGAVGVTTLMDKLLEFCPEDKPSLTFWAGYEEDMDWHQPKNHHLRRKYGIPDDCNVIVYTGNVHASNQSEVFSLYLAVALLNRKGIPIKLVRTGLNYVELFDESLDVINQYCVNLGFIDREEMPGVLAMADVLVQPGKPGDFNDYRFPSKLPEFFASGRPVILPKTNIGNFIEDGKEGVLLQEGNAVEIAHKLQWLLGNNDLMTKIGAGGKKFAEKNLKWRENADKLFDFYQDLLP